MPTNRSGAEWSGVLAAACTVCLAGCNVDGSWTNRMQLSKPVAYLEEDSTAQTGVDLSVADAHEVDLVEAVVASRRKYLQSLEQLNRYYATQGIETKRRWSEMELNGILTTKRFRYLMDAEVPAGALTASESIPEADDLYKQGMELLRRGGHGVPAVYRKDRMVEAAEVFRQLIEKYPSSDKIDDAAFYCGEIHKDYLPGQEAIAVQWYERAWEWNPNTPHPAKFQAAVVYDYRLHDRDRALELYQAVVANPDADASNARFAARRVRELTGVASARQP